MSQSDTAVELSESLLDSLSKITADSERIQFLQEQNLYSPAVVRQLNETSRKNLRIDPRRSLSLAEAALGVAGALNNEELSGSSLRARANALYVLGDNQAALASHNQALEIFRRLENREEEARTLNASIQPHILLGDYDGALAAAKAARDIFALLGDKRRLAHVEINVGNLYHRQDRFEEAIASYERAYAMFLPFDDSEGLGIALYNMSVCLISLNDFPRALATYQSAREVFVQRGMTLLIGQADYNIAYLYYLRGEYGRAIAMLRAAREQSEINGDAHIEALCYLDLSDVHLELNLSSEAGEAAQEGVQRFRKLGMGYEEAKCLANEAIAWSQQGKPLRSLDLFDEARALFVREKNRVWPSLVDLYRALALFEEGRLFEARKACQTALDFFANSNQAGKTALCHLLLARIQLQMGDFSKSLSHVADALKKINGLEAPVLEYQARFFEGEAHFAAGDEVAASAAYQRAREGLESLRTALRKEELKIPLMKNKGAVYERLVEICRNQGTQDSLRQAFEYIERTKHRELAQTILEEIQEAPRSLAGQSEMVRRIRDLREELNWYYHRIEIAQLSNELNDPEKVRLLELEADAREKSLISVLGEVSNSTGEAQSQGGPIASLQSVQAALRANTLLIEYFAVGNDLLAGLITRDSFEILPVTLLDRANALIAAFRGYLAKPRSNGDLSVCQNHLRKMYGELFEPLLANISAEQIVFVPQGALHCVPLHALFSGEQYVLDQFAVSYLPKASLAVRLKRLSSIEDGQVLFGPEAADFQAIENEIAVIAQCLDAPQIFLGGDATVARLRAARGSRSIHIAGGAIASSRGSHPGIKFGDSFLSPTEMHQLHLHTEMVSLTGSAPAPNLHAETAGNAIATIQRSLLESGVISVLANFWRNDATSEVDFFRTFYSQWRAEPEISMAKLFQKAVQFHRDRLPHPAEWASFFLTGTA